MLNQIYQGDCLKIMKRFPSEYVDLVYLDPPFNTGKEFKDFGDKWKSTKLEFQIMDNPKVNQFLSFIDDIAMFNYLWFLSTRLLECKRLLRESGSIYLHCDNHASHYLKILMDMIFGKDMFRNEIIWKYAKWTNAARYFQRNHDTILFYSKDKEYTFNKIYGEKTVHQKAILKAGFNGGTNNKGELIVRIYDRDNPNVIAKMEEWKREGRRIYYVDEQKGNPIDDVWSIPILGGTSIERTGYSTQKPLELLERIIVASSEEDDLILDPFCGSGTSLVSAKSLGRMYIGIDINPKAIKITERRLA